jgi:hypothetical protein
MKRRAPMTWGNGRHRAHLPYLLVESDDAGAAVSNLTAFWKAGFNPAFCLGPHPGETCPLQGGGRCALIDQADIVLHRLHPNLGIAKAIHQCRPSLPVVAVRGHSSGPASSNPTLAESQIAALRQALSAATTWKRSFGQLGFSQDCSS